MLNILKRISLKHLVLLSFVLNVSMYCAIHSWNKDVEKSSIITSDAAGYETLAENMVHYHTFAGAFDTAKTGPTSYLTKPDNLIYNLDTYREPGYPFFLALVYFIAGVKPFIAIFLQLLLNIISVVLIYKITLLLFRNDVVAIIAGLLFTIDIHSIYVANVLYSDTLFISLFLFSLYYFMSGLEKKNISSFIISAVFIGLACLTRPVSLLYPFVLLCILFLFYRNLGRWIVKAAICYMIIVYSIAGAWTFRNHAIYGKWQLNTMSGYNLMMFNVAFTESRNTGLPIEFVRAKLVAQCDSLGCLNMKNPFDRSAVCGKVALDYVRKNKAVYIETQLWGATHMFLSIGNIDMAQTFGWGSSNVEGKLVMDFQRLQQNFSHEKQGALGLLVIIVLILQYVGALFGVFFTIKNKKYMILTFSILTVLYFTAITGAIGKYRYKLPMQVVICSMAGYGYYSLMKRKNEA
jgi:4-amino-4-deoxy-L-arabinose transferase-like glycosyltransferase